MRLMESKKLGFVLILISIFISFYLFSISGWSKERDVLSNIRYSPVGFMCSKENLYKNDKVYYRNPEGEGCSYSPRLGNVLLIPMIILALGVLLYKEIIEQETVSNILEKIKASLNSNNQNIKNIVNKDNNKESSNKSQSNNDDWL